MKQFLIIISSILIGMSITAHAQELKRTEPVFSDYIPKVDTVSIGEFVPLVLLGTWWYDEDAQIIRFCGDDELAADMSSGMLKRIPHYYVIGVIVTRGKN